MDTRIVVHWSTGAYFRRAMLTGVLMIIVCVAPCLGRTEETTLVGPNSAKVGDLWTDIDRETDAVAKPLSPAARQAIQASVSRFYQWVAAYCGVSVSLRDLSADDARCVRDEYINFLADIPQSVYRVGRWSIYETSVYGLEWADGDLLDQDVTRPFTWRLRLKWPQVDLEPSPLSRKMIEFMKEKAHSIVSGWAVGGWEVYVALRIEAINRCYVAVGIERSVYGGGAHSNGFFDSFTWSRATDAPLNLAELFKPGIDWRHQVVILYEKHVRSGDAGVRPSILEDQPFLTEESLERSIDEDTFVTDQGLKIVIGGLAPAYGLVLPGIELKWAELQPWLVPSAACASADTTPLQP